MLQNVNIFVIIWTRNMACFKQRGGRMNLIALLIGGMLFFTAILIAGIFLK